MHSALIEKVEPAFGVEDKRPNNKLHVHYIIGHNASIFFMIKFIIIIIIIMLIIIII
jgi:hypothetical protein